MIRDMLRDVQNVPERIATTRKEATRWVRNRVYQAREQGETSLWTMHLKGLETASELLERTHDVPVLDTVGTNAKGLLEAVEKATTTPPLADYDELNVRKVMSSLRDLDRFGLLRTAHHERSHKNRKTILDAIEREMDRRARLAAA